MREVRRAVARALAGIGPESVDPLIQALRDKDPRVRGTAARALTDMGDIGAEARRAAPDLAAWLNSLLGESLVPDFAPVEAPISQSISLSLLAEFVTDPRLTFPSFDTTVSTDANNFFVLDFIQFLEYIESTFYQVNVPRFT